MFNGITNVLTVFNMDSKNVTFLRTRLQEVLFNDRIFVLAVFLSE